jgi:hypothetical protein
LLSKLKINKKYIIILLFGASDTCTDEEDVVSNQLVAEYKFAVKVEGFT